MHNHAPKNYLCPICLAIKGIESEATMIKQADIIYRDEFVIAFIGSKFIMSNPAHIIVVPIKHYENIYDLPDRIAARITKVSRLLSLALKSARRCDGITIQQNNEPAGGQHAYHYHMHIIPRFLDDEYGKNKSVIVSDPKDRLPYADALRKYL